MRELAKGLNVRFNTTATSISLEGAVSVRTANETYRGIGLHMLPARGDAESLCSHEGGSSTCCKAQQWSWPFRCPFCSRRCTSSRRCLVTGMLPRSTSGEAAYRSWMHSSRGSSLFVVADKCRHLCTVPWKHTCHQAPKVALLLRLLRLAGANRWFSKCESFRGLQMGDIAKLFIKFAGGQSPEGLLSNQSFTS